MRKKFKVFVSLAVLSAFSAVSCGNEKLPSESSVTLDLPVLTTEQATEPSTESAEENVTTEKTTATTAVTAETSTEVTEEVTTESSTETSAETPADEVTEPPVTEPPATEPPATEPPATEPPVVQQLQFSLDNLDSSAVDIVASLGDALDIQDATGCLSNGADQRIYIYDGMKLSCYMNGDTPYVYEISITNGNYSTSGGITVGSSRSDVESAYGAGEESGNYVIYYDGNRELDIEYDGDSVKSIIFYMAV